jgi:hypothetical protein
MDENPQLNFRVDKDRMKYTMERTLLGISFEKCINYPLYDFQ